MPTIQPFVREPDGSLSPSTMKAIQDDLYVALDEYSNEKYPSEHRNHLGVSVIGEKCSRKLWYNFRWVKLEKHIPRMKRLFQRGHSEEEKFAELLTWMGFYVRTIDPATSRQYRFSAVDGHYGGSGDTIALMPWFRGSDGKLDESFRISIEYKTHNKKSFEALKKDGLKKSKPQHWIQMAGYGKAFNLRYGLYCAINKDDDDIHFEFIELDWNLATLMEKKAADIIYAELPPPRIAENPAFLDCKYCHHANICWYGEKVEVNCRSCKNAKPIKDGQWQCSLYGVIPKDFVKRGCSQHDAIGV